MTTITNNKLTGLGANHPANGPLTTERLSYVRDVLQRHHKYSNGGSMDYIIADAVKAIDELLEARKAEPMAWLWTNEQLDKQSVSLTDPADEENTQDAMACGWKHQPLYTAPPAPVVPEEKRDDDGNTTSEFDHGWNSCRVAMLQGSQPVSNRDELREQVRREHAEWSDATFGNVGPVGPLKHLSKEALEAAANPEDPLEWADMQFLLWDAQRRMGISDEFVTRAMIEKLEINKSRQWPEPKDGEPRLHIKSDQRQEHM